MLFFIADGLQKKGHNVTILDLDLSKEYDMCSRYDVPTVIADIPYRGKILTNFDWIKFTRKNAKRLKSQVLIGFTEHGNFCAGTTGMLMGIPSIIAERCDPFTKFSHLPLTGKIKMWLTNRATGGVFQTLNASKFYPERIQKNSVVIPNPIFINGNVPSVNYESAPHTVVFLGRIDNKQKRLDIALDAFEIFHKKHGDYKFILYGDGPDMDFVNSYANSKNLGDCVILKGKTSTSMESISKEGIYLITSDYEGISNSLLEAMAVGMPVVATDHSPGGARFLITDHVNGLLTPIRDPKAIANALSEFAENEDLAIECGKNAKKVIERFTPESSVEKWENFIFQIVDNYK